MLDLLCGSPVPRGDAVVFHTDDEGATVGVGKRGYVLGNRCSHGVLAQRRRGIAVV